jgi:hypothetical protein
MASMRHETNGIELHGVLHKGFVLLLSFEGSWAERVRPKVVHTRCIFMVDDD